ncbi:hypothetical protein F511_15496 [Dorcoceras hygrometricum]|uniref:Uncharacterized protein n=1 Tax=Dorcoceras hygrometricum TaxID=472368 RepID=A0A2Z7DG79_9LAMI|nr:hypothetical protein F511_15496 [Dorcoceras hygrometricum]
MSLFDLQDVRIAIGSIATLDLPMVVDLIGIYGLKGPYCTLTTTDWFLQALSVIPKGSWGDVARRFTMIRWAVLLVQPDEGVSVLVVDRIGDYLPQSTEKSRVLVIPVGARHKCQQDLGESVKLHPLKVLNKKSVHTYMKKKKKKAVVPAGEISKLSGDTTGSLQSLTYKPEQEAVEKKQLEKNKPLEKEAEKKTKKKEKSVVVVKKPVVVVEKPAVAESQAALEKPKSGTISNEGTRPLSKLGASKKDEVAPKRKLVLDSPDSESTVSLPLVQITKKQRTQRTKPVTQTAVDKAESNPAPIPDISVEDEDASTTAAPEGNMVLAMQNRDLRLQADLPLLVTESSVAGSTQDNSILITCTVGHITSKQGTTPAQETEEQPTKEPEQSILANEHRAHEEEQPAPEDKETARIEQPTQEQIEEISRVVENVEETEVAEMVECLKEIRDAKSGEGPSSKKRRLM